MLNMLLSSNFESAGGYMLKVNLYWNEDHYMDRKDHETSPGNLLYVTSNEHFYSTTW